MRWFPFVLLALLAVLLQTTVVRVLTLGGARPDVMLALLVPLSLGARREDGFAAGCVLGLLRDLCSSEPFALSTGVFALLGYALARLRSSVYAEHPATHGLVAFVCSWVSSGASVAVLLSQGGSLSMAAAARQGVVIAVGTSVVSAAAGSLVWRRPRWFGLRRGVEFEDV